MKSLVKRFALIALAALLSGCHHASLHSTVPSAPPSPVQFVDVAAQDGLHYQWSIPGPRPLTILQTIGNGCAFLDYNNSGNLSILLVGTNHVSLYQGDGHGHFVDVSHQTHLDRLRGHFLGCAVGDYDNDGYDDIYLSGYRTGILLHNVHGQYFQDVTQQAGLKPQPWGTSCAFVETRPGSGRLDLFVCNYAAFGSNPQKYHQFCFARNLKTSCGPRFYSPIKDVLYLNDGHGHFIDASQTSGVTAAVTGKGLGVTCAPLDKTHLPYIAVADDEVPSNLLKPSLRNGTIHYVDIGASSGVAFDRDGNIHGGMGTDWGDYDNDGRLDLIVATYQRENKSLYHNDGGDAFSDVADQMGLNAAFPLVSFGVKWADFENNGWLDLMFANAHTQDNIRVIDTSTTYRQPTLLFLNQQGQKFTDASAASGSALQERIVGRGLAVGDFLNTGRMDALVVNSEGAPLLLQNVSPHVGHFLCLTLVGTHCNRDGYGSLVVVKTPGLTQTRLCHADGSYLSSSDKRVHVGLGAATVAQSVQVQWPDGHVDTFRNVPADHFYTATESKPTLTVNH